MMVAITSIAVGAANAGRFVELYGGKAGGPDVDVAS